MPELAHWLKQLITVLILVGFLQFLLPENELKGAVKLTMGLFIIILLIQPLGKILKMPQQLTVLNWQGEHTVFQQANRGPSTERLIQQGVQMRTAWGNDLKARNQEIIKDKIRAILGIISGFKLQRLDVSFQDTGINKVAVDAAPQGGWRRDAARQTELTQQIRNAVRLVTDLRETQIEVIWHDTR